MWCDDVVRPLVYLVVDLYSNNRWWFERVRAPSRESSQDIVNPPFVQSISPSIPSTFPRSPPPPSPTLPAANPSTAKPTTSSYTRIATPISQPSTKDSMPQIIGKSDTLDTFTKRTALFSGFEVKPASGDHTEAELQMSIWIAASLRKKQELARITQAQFEPTTMVEPALTIVGHEHSVYYAFPREDLVSGRSGVHVLGPDLDRFERLSTDSIRGIFRLVMLYGNLLKYGMDEGEDGYWGGFFRPVLNKLAGISQDHVNLNLVTYNHY